MFKPHTVLLIALLTGCTTDNGEWPSLARRPGESGGECCGAQTPPAPPAVAKPEPSAPAAPAAPSAPLPDLDALQSRLDRARAAWAHQRGRAEAAVRGATGKSPAETAWAAAELELTRLESEAQEFGDVAVEAGVVTSSQRAVEIAAGARAAATEHLALYAELRAQLARVRQ